MNKSVVLGALLIALTLVQCYDTVGVAVASQFVRMFLHTAKVADAAVTIATALGEFFNLLEYISTLKLPPTHEMNTEFKSTFDDLSSILDSLSQHKHNLRHQLRLDKITDDTDNLNLAIHYFLSTPGNDSRRMLVRDCNDFPPVRGMAALQRLLREDLLVHHAKSVNYVSSMVANVHDLLLDQVRQLILFHGICHAVTKHEPLHVITALTANVTTMIDEQKLRINGLYFPSAVHDQVKVYLDSVREPLFTKDDMNANNEAAKGIMNQLNTVFNYGHVFAVRVSRVNSTVHGSLPEKSITQIYYKHWSVLVYRSNYRTVSDNVTEIMQEKVTVLLESYEEAILVNHLCAWFSPEKTLVEVFKKIRPLCSNFEFCAVAEADEGAIAVSASIVAFFKFKMCNKLSFNGLEVFAGVRMGSISDNEAQEKYKTQLANLDQYVVQVRKDVKMVRRDIQRRLATTTTTTTTFTVATNSIATRAPERASGLMCVCDSVADAFDNNAASYFGRSFAGLIIALGHFLFFLKF